MRDTAPVGFKTFRQRHAILAINGERSHGFDNAISPENRFHRIQVLVNIRPSLVPSLLRVAALCVMIGLVGCETPTSSPTQEPVPRQIHVGMKKDQVREIMGKPAQIVPGEGNGSVEESWVYRIQQPPEMRNVITRMEEVPFVNPRSGVMTTIEEPVTEQERIDRTEILTLLFRDDQLANINRAVQERRSVMR